MLTCGGSTRCTGKAWPTRSVPRPHRASSHVGFGTAATVATEQRHGGNSVTAPGVTETLRQSPLGNPLLPTRADTRALTEGSKAQKAFRAARNSSRFCKTRRLQPVERSAQRERPSHFGHGAPRCRSAAPRRAASRRAVLSVPTDAIPLQHRDYLNSQSPHDLSAGWARWLRVGTRRTVRSWGGCDTPIPSRSTQTAGGLLRGSCRVHSFGICLPESTQGRTSAGTFPHK